MTRSLAQRCARPSRDTLVGPALHSLGPCHIYFPMMRSPALAYIAVSARYPATYISVVCVIYIKGYVAHYPERITSASYSFVNLIT